MPGGFSNGDEPDGSGKFIAIFLRSPVIREAVQRLLDDRQGLICGICNGFQALIKTGLLPFGRIVESDELNE
ncbi:MAG: phosphoribosylformylglycinamidine synthase subunit PurQ, partial [Synergistaceae bacterium]|nr:phosphoribosylformylglycinamidine synthase subunit PurQ [Synergistaceae bacterium]